MEAPTPSTFKTIVENLADKWPGVTVWAIAVEVEASWIILTTPTPGVFTRGAEAFRSDLVDALDEPRSTIVFAAGSLPK